MPVLICDDSRVMRSILAKLCGDAGVSAHIDCDGQQGVEMCRSTSYDLVILDEVMPFYRGLEAARLIRALPEPFNTPALVLLTTKPRSYFTDSELFLAGIDEVIQKPFNVEDMRALFIRGKPIPGLFPRC